MNNTRAIAEKKKTGKHKKRHLPARAHTLSFYLINGITLYRAVAAFALLYFLITQKTEPFKWLLAVSFFTDAIDGFLARKFKAVSVAGARLDSLADDLTMVMGIAGIAVFDPAFVREHWLPISLLTGLYLLQLLLAFLRYGKPTAFHTYLAKGAAVFQGVFLILFFFLPQPPVALFYAAAAVTAADVAEEIALVLLLPRWRADVRGLFWVK